MGHDLGDLLGERAGKVPSIVWESIDVTEFCHEVNQPVNGNRESVAAVQWPSRAWPLLTLGPERGCA
jgi:hypothetical protein